MALHLLHMLLHLQLLLLMTLILLQNINRAAEMHNETA